MILLAPGTTGKKHSGAKGGNKCTELGKRQVLHSLDAPLQLFVGGGSPINSEIFLGKSSVIYFGIHVYVTHVTCLRLYNSKSPREVSIFFSDLSRARLGGKTTKARVKSL